ncbi:hypothetical protein CERSUDRAFT_91451 [Gelatoporia subvermispora B]|uniref:Uncharacterized protein n=1 Tax=Ceriporiopsis subvermispora (strain B) TaxID=914234 RepID=M2R8H5_CERS8|nr:hypothetical protein CERSUDRAFT_91451 [Gelatoporia subvermispora B]
MVQQRVDSSAPIPVVENHMDETRPAAPETRKQPSTLTHLLILSSILVPIALLPYLTVRARLTTLQRSVAEGANATTGLRRDLSHLIAAFSARRTEQDRLVSLLNETNANVGWLRRKAEQAVVDRAASEARMLKELRATRLELEKLESDAARSEQARQLIERDRLRLVQSLKSESDRIRTRLSGLEELGSSLADIAAFMHEVELQQALPPKKGDGRGIERIRQLAYKWQNAQTPEQTATDASNDNNQSSSNAGSDTGR